MKIATILMAGWALVGLALPGAQAQDSGRETIALDGEWEIADSVGAEQLPVAYPARVRVPGLVRYAKPAFADVDRFDSRELLLNRSNPGYAPNLGRNVGVGIPRQERNYFWYARNFRAPGRRGVALLRVGKAQFTTAVWLNGRKLGEHASCFSSGTFDATAAINWNGENRLVIRVGAHPAVVPLEVPAGTDSEKTKWTPGIYDRVELRISDAASIESVQVAPRLAGNEIVVQAELRNRGAAPAAFELVHEVYPWRGAERVVAGAPLRGELAPGEMRTVVQTLAMLGARRWSPDDPFLYEVRTRSGGDSERTRFGMREFRFDTPTRRAYLNGRPIYLRGSNITLHRFFEDEACGELPWDEAWLQRLLVEIPRELHWNAFRFCIGPVPQRWLEIADEAGLLIQYEYPIWTGPNQESFPAVWTEAALIAEFTAWMRDSWNHPSVVIWDACNETVAPVLGERVIPALRGFDLSSRPWENGYNPPVGPDDPVESHPYEGMRVQNPFTLDRLQTASPARLGNHMQPTDHAVIINEYGWLWLNRDGTPTELTRKGVYERLLGPDSTTAERFELLASYLGGITEFWRVHRHMAGVLHFVYLTSSYPGAFTSDNFTDVRTLTLEPRFRDYVSEAFKPLGLYVHYWLPTHRPGIESRVPVRMINDFDRPVRGRVRLAWETTDGVEVAATEESFAIEPLGAVEVSLVVRAPEQPGKYLLKATARPDEPIPGGATVSRRRVEVVAAEGPTGAPRG